MVKKATKKQEASRGAELVEVERTFVFPEQGVVVKAKNIEAATKQAQKKAKEK